VRDRQVRGSVVVFRGVLTIEPRRALELLIDRFRPFGYTPSCARRRHGGGAGVAACRDRRAPADRRERAPVRGDVPVDARRGALVRRSPTFDALRASSSAARFLAGLPFAFTLMAILGVHELGHYVTARYYRAAVSLPYFIPRPSGSAPSARSS